MYVMPEFFAGMRIDRPEIVGFGDVDDAAGDELKGEVETVDEKGESDAEDFADRFEDSARLFVARDREFEREALPWLDDVYRFALSLTHDAVDAEDVVQDTFLRAYKSWHTYVPESDCRRWLFTICRNVFLRSLERRSPTVDFGDRENEALVNGAMFRDASTRDSSEKASETSVSGAA